MTKVQTKNVAAKLRYKNIFLLFGFFLFGSAAYLLLPYYLPAGLLLFLCSGVCVWRLVSPTIHYLPPTRHAVVSLDISGASKSIRFVRTNVGSYVPTIYTPQTDKTTVVQMVNSRLQKADNGTIKSTSDFVPMDKYKYNGLHHKTVLDTFELDFAGAICIYSCLLVRSKNNTIFDAVTLKQYLTYLQPRIFFAVLVVRVLLAVTTSLYYSYLIACRFYSSPTPPKGVETPENSPNSVMVYKKQQSVKEVGYAS